MTLRGTLGCAAALSMVAAVAMSAWVGSETPSGPALDPLVEAGRAVYIAEGCIHCHSQYVRPVGLDAELWGPVTVPEEALSQRPVLIGNRRQGPDLANIGQRRSKDWNRRHLIHPRAVSPGSRMPSYPHLFAGDAARGEALLVYLNQLRPALKADSAPALNAKEP